MSSNIYNKRSGTQYVSQQELFIEWSKSIEQGKCTDKLIMYFRRIAKRFMSSLQYINKQDINACVEYAVAEAWQKWDTFNPERSSNIFSYFTTMIANDIKLHYRLITKGKDLAISIESLFDSNKEQ